MQSVRTEANVLGNEAVNLRRQSLVNVLPALAGADEAVNLRKGAFLVDKYDESSRTHSRPLPGCRTPWRHFVRCVCVLCVLSVRRSVLLLRDRCGALLRSLSPCARGGGAPRSRGCCRTDQGAHARQRTPLKERPLPERRARIPRRLPHGSMRACSRARAAKSRRGHLRASKAPARKLIPTAGQGREP